MKYEIPPPDDVVEASFSSAPDDLSLATIRIVATLEEAWNDLQHLDIQLSDTLTVATDVVSPTADAPSDWRFEYLASEGVFRATPRLVAPPESGASWTFTLADIPVAVGAGGADIVVTEARAQSTTTHVLDVRKTRPAFIRWFRPVRPDSPPIAGPPSVSLEWTTSPDVTEVMLYGPDGRVPIRLLATDGSELAPSDPEALDHVHHLGTVDVTSTFTLVARSIGAEYAIAETTVTVGDGTVEDESVEDRDGGPPTLSYEIQQPDDVVEASFSSAPDDLSRATIRVLATLEGTWSVEQDHDQDEDQVPTRLLHIDMRLPDTLTTTPGAAVPQVGEPGLWSFGFIESEGVFRATPRFVDESGAFTPVPGLAVPPASGTSWTFTLRDVHVAQGAGPTELHVVESPGASASPIILPIRKVQPQLRIDFFHPIDAQSNVTTVVKSDELVSLAWATTGATDVWLYGPEGRDPIPLRHANGTPIEPFDMQTLDHVQELGTVQTTGTYTLVARGIGAEQAIAQTTVTVDDQVAVRRLTVSGEVVEDLEIRDHLGVLALGSTSGTSPVEIDGAPPRPGEDRRTVVVDADLQLQRLIVRDAVQGDLKVWRLETQQLSGLPDDGHPPGDATHDSASLGVITIPGDLLISLGPRRPGRPEPAVQTLALRAPARPESDEPDGKAADDRGAAAHPPANEEETHESATLDVGAVASPLRVRTRWYRAPWNTPPERVELVLGNWTLVGEPGSLRMETGDVAHTFVARWEGNAFNGDLHREGP